MKYQCETCHKIFIHAAKKTVEHIPVLFPNLGTSASFPEPKEGVKTSLESSVCPFCQSLTYTEATEPEPAVEAVYVYDLTSGDQKLLATLLAEGWIITSRYAKQYILEKPKVEVKTE